MKASHYKVNIERYTQNYEPWFKKTPGGISWKISL